MELILKAGASCIVSVILITAVKAQNKETSMALALTACTLMLAAFIPSIRSLLSSLKELAAGSGLESTVLITLSRACTIVIVTQMVASFCCEAGETALGKTMELCGSIAAITAAIPLLEAVMSLIREIAA